MSSQAFNYAFNVSGDSVAVLANITQSVNILNVRMKESESTFEKWTSRLGVFNDLVQGVQNFSAGLNSVLAPGEALNASLSGLSAVSGVTGDNLKLLERYARDTSMAFGGSAAQGVESYRLLISRLGPELAKAPEALKAMGDHVAVLGKMMGGDGVAAAGLLTTAMNGYGVSLADPLDASREMAEMMNVMAAGARAGSAGLPMIQSALEGCGATAKSAGVSFEDTNAAIQLLDKAGKRGADGGQALRNVMELLSGESFLPDGAFDELAAAGVDVDVLTDRTRSLAERLSPLKAVLNDSSLLTRLFGKDNRNVAMALVDGTDDLVRYSEAVTGTSVAFEQAGTVMDSYNEKKARVQARMEDFKVSLFNVTGDFGLWVQVVAEGLVPLAQLSPLITGVGKAMKAVKDIDFKSVFSNLASSASASVSSFTGTLMSGIRSGVTRFAGVVSGAFTALKTLSIGACRAIGTAVMSIPLLGWIAAAIAAVVALGVYFWNTSATFRAVLKGIGAAFTATFKGIWELAKNVFGSLGDLIAAAFSFDGKGISNALEKMKDGFSDFGTNVGKAFNEAYDAEMASSKAEQEAKGREAEGGMAVAEAGGGAISTGLSGIGGTEVAGGGARSVNISIDKLVERFEIHTTNLHEDAGRIRELVTRALTDAVNDVNYAV